jgi:hypothetical protein
MDFDEYYVDDTAKGKGTHYKYNREMMLEYVGTFDPKKVNFQKFSATQLWLYLALEKFSPKCVDVLAVCPSFMFTQGQARACVRLNGSLPRVPAACARSPACHHC